MRTEQKRESEDLTEANACEMSARDSTHALALVVHPLAKRATCESGAFRNRR